MSFFKDFIYVFDRKSISRGRGRGRERSSLSDKGARSLIKQNYVLIKTLTKNVGIRGCQRHNPVTPQLTMTQYSLIHVHNNFTEHNYPESTVYLLHIKYFSDSRDSAMNKLDLVLSSKCLHFSGWE